jgi:hypothetical protein
LEYPGIFGITCEQNLIEKPIKIAVFKKILFEKDLKFAYQRFINNNNTEFTEQEIMTIYLFVISQEKRWDLKFESEDAMTKLLFLDFMSQEGEGEEDYGI